MILETYDTQLRLARERIEDEVRRQQLLREARTRPPLTTRIRLARLRLRRFARAALRG